MGGRASLSGNDKIWVCSDEVADAPKLGGQFGLSNFLPQRTRPLSPPSKMSTGLCGENEGVAWVSLPWPIPSSHHSFLRSLGWLRLVCRRLAFALRDSCRLHSIQFADTSAFFLTVPDIVNFRLPSHGEHYTGHPLANSLFDRRLH
jgi:hypothetical protein